ncbi:hypothetical protein V8F20_000433 [Naviculisporaceae sp. PSN 640]
MPYVIVFGYRVKGYIGLSALLIKKVIIIYWSLDKGRELIKKEEENKKEVKRSLKWLSRGGKRRRGSNYYKVSLFRNSRSSRSRRLRWYWRSLFSSSAVNSAGTEFLGTPNIAGLCTASVLSNPEHSESGNESHAALGDPIFVICPEQTGTTKCNNNGHNAIVMRWKKDNCNVVQVGSKTSQQWHCSAFSILNPTKRHKKFMTSENKGLDLRGTSAVLGFSVQRQPKIRVSSGTHQVPTSTGTQLGKERAMGRFPQSGLLRPRPLVIESGAPSFSEQSLSAGHFQYKLVKYPVQTSDQYFYISLYILGMDFVHSWRNS